MIWSYYAICNGQPMFAVSKRENEQSEGLLSGFLAAFQMFASNLDKSRVSKIELNTSTYYYAIIHPIISVVEAQTPEDEVEARVYQIAAERLGRAFVEKYSVDALSKWCGNLEDYKDFEEDFKRITSELTSILKEKHKDFISEYFVEAAKDENILGVVVYDLEKDEIISANLPKAFSRNDFETFGSMLFSFVDKLGKELKSGDINEMILRAKNYWIGGFRKNQMAVFMIFSHEYFGSILPKFVKRLIE